MLLRPTAGTAHGVHDARAIDLRANASEGELHAQLQARVVLGAAPHGGVYCGGSSVCVRPLRRGLPRRPESGGSGHMDDRRSSGVRGEGDGAPAICRLLDAAARETARLKDSRTMIMPISSFKPAGHRAGQLPTPEGFRWSPRQLERSL